MHYRTPFFTMSVRFAPRYAILHNRTGDSGKIKNCRQRSIHPLCLQSSTGLPVSRTFLFFADCRAHGEEGVGLIGFRLVKDRQAHGHPIFGEDRSCREALFCFKLPDDEIFNS